MPNTPDNIDNKNEALQSVSAKTNLVQQEAESRIKRDQALENFRKGKVFGSFNSDYVRLQGFCNDRDKTFQNSLAAQKEYLNRLKEAEKNGKSANSVSGPSRSMFDNAVVDYTKRGVRSVATRAVTLLTWVAVPAKAYGDIAGDLWDMKEFGEVKKAISQNEAAREKLMNDIDLQTKNQKIKMNDRAKEENKKKAELAEIDKIRKQLQVKDKKAA